MFSSWFLLITFFQFNKTSSSNFSLIKGLNVNLSFGFVFNMVLFQRYSHFSFVFWWAFDISFCDPTLVSVKIEMFWESGSLKFFFVFKLRSFGDLFDLPKYLWIPDDLPSSDSPSYLPSYFS